MSATAASGTRTTARCTTRGWVGRPNTDPKSTFICDFVLYDAVPDAGRLLRSLHASRDRATERGRRVGFHARIEGDLHILVRSGTDARGSNEIRVVGDQLPLADDRICV